MHKQLQNNQAISLYKKRRNRNRGSQDRRLQRLPSLSNSNKVTVNLGAPSLSRLSLRRQNRRLLELELEPGLEPQRRKKKNQRRAQEVQNQRKRKVMMIAVLYSDIYYLYIFYI